MEKIVCDLDFVNDFNKNIKIFGFQDLKNIYYFNKYETNSLDKEFTVMDLFFHKEVHSIVEYEKCFVDVYKNKIVEVLSIEDTCNDKSLPSYTIYTIDGDFKDWNNIRIDSIIGEEVESGKFTVKSCPRIEFEGFINNSKSKILYYFRSKKGMENFLNLLKKSLDTDFCFNNITESHFDFSEKSINKVVEECFKI